MDSVGYIELQAGNGNNFLSLTYCSFHISVFMSEESKTKFLEERENKEEV